MAQLCPREKLLKADTQGQNKFTQESFSEHRKHAADLSGESGGTHSHSPVVSGSFGGSHCEKHWSEDRTVGIANRNVPNVLPQLFQPALNRMVLPMLGGLDTPEQSEAGPFLMLRLLSTGGYPLLDDVHKKLSRPKTRKMRPATRPS